MVLVGVVQNPISACLELGIGIEYENTGLERERCLEDLQQLFNTIVPYYPHKIVILER